MFDRIREYQENIADRLEGEIRSGIFSQAVLFCGERYSGRMTTALEVARVLSCPDGGDDSCRCESCMKYREMDMDNVLIVSSRDHRAIVETALEKFETLKTSFAADFLIRSIMIMLMQYHHVLIEGRKDDKVYEKASDIDTLLMSFREERDFDEKSAKSYADQFRTMLKPVLDSMKKSSPLTVDTVRNIISWTYETQSEQKAKFVIIENMESANISVVNALLKTLEEPSEGVYFILISSNPSAMLQTVLSRVRKYYFPSFSPEKVRSLTSKFYVDDPEIDTMEKFFLVHGSFDLKKMEDDVSSFIRSAVLSDGVDMGDIAEKIISFTEGNRPDFTSRLMCSEIRLLWKDGSIDTAMASGMLNLIEDQYSRCAVFNQNLRSFYEGLYLGLRSVACQR